MKQLLGLLAISGAVLPRFFPDPDVEHRLGTAPMVGLKPGQVIQEDSIVSIEYTLTDDTGKVVDSNVGKSL